MIDVLLQGMKDIDVFRFFFNDNCITLSNLILCSEMPFYRIFEGKIKSQMIGAINQEVIMGNLK